MKFLRNAWYMVAWSGDVREKPFSRTILSIPMVLFRQLNGGALVALQDRCPHRFAPLSMGEVTEHGIECRYHGLQFNAQGRCVLNPFSSAAPAAARVDSYPVHEVDGTIWVWPGDPAMADVAKVPRVKHHNVAATLRPLQGTTHLQGDYRLLSDNLMDLSHTYTLHPGLGGRAYRPKVRTWEESDGRIAAEFRIDDMDNFFGEDVIPEPKVRHSDTMVWQAPSTHLLFSRTGPNSTGEVTVEILSAHILTPETEASTHYFWSSSVPANLPRDIIHGALIDAFDNEDKVMVEAVHRAMAGQELFELNPVLLSSDAGAVRVRRKFAELVAAEQSA